MIRFLKEHPQYYSLYILIGFFLFIVVWFSTKDVSSQQTGYSSANLSTSAIAFKGEFSPDASNVTSTTTKQLDALRVRVEANPEDTMHVVRLARMLQDAHQPDEAVTYYTRYLALRPTNRQAWLDLSHNLAELKRWEEAREATETMLIHYSDDPSGLYNLGAIHANQANIEKARQIWTQVAAQSTDPALAEMASASMGRLNAFLKPSIQ